MDNETLREEAISASGLNLTDFTLNNFNYENNVIQEVMLRNLYDTNFIGVTVSSTIIGYSSILYIMITTVRTYLCSPHTLENFLSF